MEQTYSEKDTIAHAQWLAKAFADPRYLQIYGRPLFLVYRPAKLPDPKRFTDLLRSEITRLAPRLKDAMMEALRKVASKPAPAENTGDLPPSVTTDQTFKVRGPLTLRPKNAAV